MNPFNNQNSGFLKMTALIISLTVVLNTGRAAEIAGTDRSPAIHGASIESTIPARPLSFRRMFQAHETPIRFLYQFWRRSGWTGGSSGDPESNFLAALGVRWEVEAAAANRFPGWRCRNERVGWGRSEIFHALFPFAEVAYDTPWFIILKDGLPKGIALGRTVLTFSDCSLAPWADLLGVPQPEILPAYEEVQVPLLNQSLIIFRGVRSPQVHPVGRESSSDVLLRDLPPRLSGHVLVPGCGPGLLGFAAFRRGARRVTAFDDNPLAVWNARCNVARLGLQGRIQVHAASRLGELPRKADLYDAIAANVPVQDIIHSPEIHAMIPRLVSQNTHDPEGRLLKEILLNGKTRLNNRNPQAAIYLAYLAGEEEAISTLGAVGALTLVQHGSRPSPIDHYVSYTLVPADRPADGMTWLRSAYSETHQLLTPSVIDDPPESRVSFKEAWGIVHFAFRAATDATLLSTLSPSREAWDFACRHGPQVLKTGDRGFDWYDWTLGDQFHIALGGQLLIHAGRYAYYQFPERVRRIGGDSLVRLVTVLMSLIRLMHNLTVRLTGVGVMWTAGSGMHDPISPLELLQSLQASELERIILNTKVSKGLALQITAAVEDTGKGSTWDDLRIHVHSRLAGIPIERIDRILVSIQLDLEKRLAASGDGAAILQPIHPALRPPTKVEVLPEISAQQSDPPIGTAELLEAYQTPPATMTAFDGTPRGLKLFSEEILRGHLRSAEEGAPGRMALVRRLLGMFTGDSWEDLNAALAKGLGSGTRAERIVETLREAIEARTRLPNSLRESV